MGIISQVMSTIIRLNCTKMPLEPNRCHIFSKIYLIAFKFRQMQQKKVFRMRNLTVVPLDQFLNAVIRPISVELKLTDQGRKKIIRIFSFPLGYSRCLAQKQVNSKSYFLVTRHRTLRYSYFNTKLNLPINHRKIKSSYCQVRYNIFFHCEVSPPVKIMP